MDYKTPENKSENKLHKKWWFWIVVAMVLLSLINNRSEKKAIIEKGNLANSQQAEEIIDNDEEELIDNSDKELYEVVKVVDGDTINVNINGKVETLRLIGINTPETVDPRKAVICFGKEASDKAKQLLTNKKVRLEGDATQGERDKYQRLLRYVWLEDGTFFNKLMISEGYAFEYTYDTIYKYQAEFKQAEISARTSKKGLWADNVCDQTKVQTPVQIITSQPADTSKINCSSNTYNCTDFKRQKEAQQVFDFCGGVNNDIHKLDADKDGLVCESLP
ncbi:MAG: hypothetical protein A2312_00360 [Candidatus Staskawiczbacteria bacterium RIFOXYB2_FULL_32_9]|uniref:TNase-like domain-containing protein n=1 Tax=Candidatus Staskawiczbacteria bacterium RIFOXYD1_FULL_32_13 TaxID=1802234 RepID=A0A1G2JKV1_9BACT|nr:MAG: Micrococcal nuclease [Parcubacteria group bacterium GW2011_GWC2_32_10]OGZ77559.1 MAG: hypothetical protein A2256_02250 [Candidatus Staskawiczbacteria bacterium RIFOXYA2_FULL_32_7]OGZ78261.1 MAG: hypothetical protein A2360_03780 [Candidatus Staskawiczbacteria bacterium RIFOXYB1_FULL_32_11]OGZ84546.1 MAG: hypothetical protein A2312_00360 [Candidatus Staskawiczbacteria bacterium RIFOXYB2_FULL_32_9]OGZ85154.1 MAG: hypothetical protein A2463_00090 [Candidatus Staskawiczbacteria bacterium RIF